MAARRRRLRRAGGPDRARPRRARGPRARRLARARPAQVAVPAVRDRLRARARAGAARAHVRAVGRLPARHAGRRGQLPRPLGPAHARRPRAEAVAVDPRVRAGRVPRRGRPRDRAGRARRGAAARAARLGGRDARRSSRSSASAATATTRCRRGIADGDGRRRLRRAEHDRGRRPRGAASVHDQPADDRRRRRADDRAHGGAVRILRARLDPRARRQYEWRQGRVTDEGSSMARRSLSVVVARSARDGRRTGVRRVGGRAALVRHARARRGGEPARRQPADASGRQLPAHPVLRDQVHAAGHPGAQRRPHAAGGHRQVGDRARHVRRHHQPPAHAAGADATTPAGSPSAR